MVKCVLILKTNNPQYEIRLSKSVWHTADLTGGLWTAERTTRWKVEYGKMWPCDDGIFEPTREVEFQPKIIRLESFIAQYMDHNDIFARKVLIAVRLDQDPEHYWGSELYTSTPIKSKSQV